MGEQPTEGHASRPWDCVVVAGNGSSGTKRLLRMLDQSPLTHCRNEPNLLLGSPFQELEDLGRGVALTDADRATLDAEWEAAIAWTAARMGFLDALPSPPKRHLHAIATGAGLGRIVASRSARLGLSLFASDLRRLEWRLPPWLGDRARLRDALLVMKLNQRPAYSHWLLEARARTKVVHIVRHPAAYANSWLARHLAIHDPEAVRDANAKRLRCIAERDARWREAFGDIDARSVEETELLFWLYATVSTEEWGQGRSSYLRVCDEEVIADPIGSARTLYEACGLPWTPTLQSWLESWSAEWQRKTQPWREIIPDDVVPLIERTLAHPALRSWWKDDQRVSRIDYDWR